VKNRRFGEKTQGGVICLARSAALASKCKIVIPFSEIFPSGGGGGLPPYVRVESRWLDGEPFMPPEYAMTCDWVRCQRIRRSVDQSRKREVIMPFDGCWWNVEINCDGGGLIARRSVRGGTL
jgi:hypothetical protein